MHKHIKKHVRKHKRKYTRFILYFLILLTFGVIEDVTAVYLTTGEELLEVVLVAVFLSFVFTVIGEGIELLWERERNIFKK